MDDLTPFERRILSDLLDGPRSYNGRAWNQINHLRDLGLIENDGFGWTKIGDSVRGVWRITVRVVDARHARAVLEQGR